MPHPPSEAFRLQFLGASGTVTGSRYLLEAGGSRLLVDCGLFQGYKQLRLRNWAPFPVPAESIEGVLLTHAHLDHSGYLPRLVRSGFTGTIWCAPGTEALCRILLPDSARLLEEEAAFANRKGSSRHQPALPLYTEADAHACLRRFAEVPFDEEFEPLPGVRARFRRAGHILGAASVLVGFQGRKVLFSGDIGRSADPLMQPPLPPPEADWIVCESTYGNRSHAAVDTRTELGDVLRPVLAREGVAIIPSFAVGRAQMLLHAITTLQDEGALPRVPLYLNSPMATNVAALYGRYPEQHRLDSGALKAMQDNTRIVNSVEESKALNRRRGPMVIVAGSGMVTGGRVLHHLLAFAGDPRNAIVLCGFQAGGTRGATLASGGRGLRIYGQDLLVRAEVHQLGAASAHADADELLAWLRSSPRPPSQVLLTHGEPEAADALRFRIEHELGWEASVPEYLGWVDLAADLGAPRSPASAAVPGGAATVRAESPRPAKRAMDRLAGRVCIVTGGSVGIGRACVERMAGEGARVAIFDLLDEPGNALARALQDSGTAARYWHVDVSDEAAVQAAIDAVAEHFGAIHCLVNNAGISGTTRPTHEVTEAEWDRVMAVNVKGVFFCTKHVIPHLKRAGGGSVINLSSIYGLVGAPDVPPYHASKGAVRLMSPMPCCMQPTASG